MTDNLVDALAKLWIAIFGRQKLSTDTDVARVPALTAIIRPIVTACGNGHMQTIAIRLVRKDRMQTEAAAARHPLRPVRMIVKTTVERPRCPRIVRAKE